MGPRALKLLAVLTALAALAGAVAIAVWSQTAAFLIERGPGESAREEGESPAAAAPLARKSREKAEQDAYGYPDAATGTEDAGVGPRVGGPEHELREASELPGEATASPEPAQDSPMREQALESVTATGAMKEAAAEAAADAAAPATASTPFAGGLVESVPPSPETWYRQIRKMFAEGRRAEAERELAALRKAYPDWAAKHVKPEDLR